MSITLIFSNLIYHFWTLSIVEGYKNINIICMIRFKVKKDYRKTVYGKQSIGKMIEEVKVKS